MTFVITRLCQDCVDGACVDHCPVDAIVEHRPSDEHPSDLPRQLFINPQICIDCAACVPECPWEAIYDEDDVPAAFESDTALNARTLERPKEFHVPITRLRKGATEEEVDSNKARWGIARRLSA
jgi:ferredoxin